MKLSTLSSFVVVFAIGLFVGWFSNPPTTKDLEPLSEAESGIQDQVTSITAAEFAEYENLKTLEEKYKKADEILGKIVAIFIADIGMRIQKPTLELPPPAAEQIAPAPALAGASAASDSVAVTSIGGSEPAKPKSTWTAAEKNLQDIRNENEASEFLKQAAISDLSEALKVTGRFTNSTGLLDQLTGTYTGKAFVKVKDQSREWDILMRMTGQMVGGSLKGRANIEMSENGKRFSNSRDGGDIKSFREFTNGSSAILVGAAPGTYFQLYYIKGMNAMMGNVYDQTNDEGPYNLIGTINLSK